MPILEDIDNLRVVIGKAGLSALFPKEFEYYAITLELTDSIGRTVEYLTFPVNPDTLDHVNKRMVNIKKTAGGVTALDIEGFIPQQMTLSGTFGRQLKLIVNQAETISAQNSTSKGVFDPVNDQSLQINNAIISSKIKTGYGAIKLLESIVNKSSSLDEYNRPHRLYYYSPAQGHSWLVKANNFQQHQDIQSTNMLWKYTFNLTAIAPVYNTGRDSENPTSLINSTAYNVLQRTGNVIINNIKKSIF